MAHIKKQTSDKPSTLASKVLSGKIQNPTQAQIKTLAATALSQDEKKGKRGK